ncbi:hypothetical protein Tco_1104269 [Tanacetum coccineum]
MEETCTSGPTSKKSKSKIHDVIKKEVRKTSRSWIDLPYLRSVPDDGSLMDDFSALGILSKTASPFRPHAVKDVKTQLNPYLGEEPFYGQRGHYGQGEIAPMGSPPPRIDFKVIDTKEPEPRSRSSVQNGNPYEHVPAIVHGNEALEISLSFPQRTPPGDIMIAHEFVKTDDSCQRQAKLTTDENASNSIQVWKSLTLGHRLMARSRLHEGTKLILWQSTIGPKSVEAKATPHQMMPEYLQISEISLSPDLVASRQS